MSEDSFGKIILLNGASSAGKSTLCRAIQAQIDEPFLQFSLDFFMFGPEIIPRRWEEAGFGWEAMRPKIFEGYYNCLPALAQAGNNLVIDYIIETPQQFQQLIKRLAGFDVFFVGVHCPLPELIRREKLRKDRRSGDALRDYQTVHSFSSYDLEVDSTRPASQNAGQIIATWKTRKRPGVFELLSSGVLDHL